MALQIPLLMLLTKLLPSLILNRICHLIDDTTRDHVALSIFRASLEAFVWVLLDGGPSRAFSCADISSMEYDFKILQDFLVADDEGLPRSLVEKEAKFSHQTGSILQMLMTASENILVDLELQRPSQRCLDDANTLIRVLCHKKDQEASKLLHEQYGCLHLQHKKVVPAYRNLFDMDKYFEDSKISWSGMRSTFYCLLQY